MKRGARWLLLLVAGWTSTSQAALVRELRFDSVPTGAEVFLLQGTRQVTLGVTPLTYQAEFHSEMSVLRFAIKKSGYETQTTEVSPKQERVVAKLHARAFAAPAKVGGDPQLRGLQERLAPVINHAAASLPGTKASMPYEVGLARVAKLGGKDFLVVPVELQEGEKHRADPTRNGHEGFLRQVWDQAGREIAVALAAAVRREDSSIGVVLDIGYQRLRHGFAVNSRVETTLEMQCFPGTVANQVYDTCARQRSAEYGYDWQGRRYMVSSGGCEGGYVTRYVQDACAYKAPATRSAVKIDPLVTLARSQMRAQYVLPPASMKYAGESRDFYERLGVLLTDAEGKPLIRQGDIPKELPRIP